MMKKYSILTIPFLLGSHLASGAILQTFGSSTIAGDGFSSGNLMTDTTTDTGDWIDDLNDGGTVYLGFDYTVDDNGGESGSGGYFGGIGLMTGPSALSDALALIGNGWTSLNYTVSSDLGTGDSGTPYVVGTTVRLVAELIVVDGGTSNDTIRLWINPSSISDPAAIGATVAEFEGFSHLYTRGGDDPGQTTTNNTIVATTFDEAAIPEPSTALLSGLGLLALLRRSRRS